MDDDSPLTGIVLVLLFIVMNAVVTAMKSALENVSEGNLKKKADAGDARAAAVLKLTDNHISILAAQLLICFNHVMIGSIFFAELLVRLERAFTNSNIPQEGILRLGCSILCTVLLILAVTLFGTVLPGKLALKHAEAISCRSVRLIRFLGYILRPFTWLLDKLATPSVYDNVTEDEIISMVNEGHEQGVFDDGEVEMISNIMELDDKSAHDIMTHKARIVAMDATMTVEEALQFMLEENYSRYPLYEGNRDNIIGILHLKDVIGAYISEENKTSPLRDIAREPYYVPDTQNINILFRDMQQKNIHMAIAIDEYGQTSGIVAMEDFIEEIVGNIQDEYDEDEKLVLSIDSESCVVKGSISLEELADELNISIEHEDYDTLNGLLISILGRIPSDGEKASLEYEEYLFDILETRNKMIEQVRISGLKNRSIYKENSEDRDSET